MSGWQPLTYFGVFVAAAVEGEAVFIAASVAVALGQLNGWAVLVAGALGGTAGDQLFFYGFRGRLSTWLDRIPHLSRRRDALAGRVRRYAALLVASCRFLPGLRIAIPAACAYAHVSPALFSLLSLASSFVWAAFVMTLVAWAGPQPLITLGLARGWAVAATSGIALLVFVLLRRITLISSTNKPLDGTPALRN